MDILKDIRLIVFDFDGTLFHLKVNWFRLKEELNKSKHMRNMNMGDILQQAKNNKDQGTLDIVTKAELDSVAGQHIDTDIQRVLRSLMSDGYKVAIFTRNSRRVVEKTLSSFKDASHIEIVGREDVMNLKPDPEGLKRLMGHANSNRSSTILIGDTSHDVIVAKSILVRVGIVKNTNNKYQPKGADYYMDHIATLIEQTH